MIKEFTATVYIIDNQKVLLIFHRKLQKWLPPGGHVELNETPPEAARREVLEEVGVEIEFLLQENVWVKQWNAQSIERPYLCLLEEIPPYQHHPAHQHIDMIYVAKPIAIVENFQADFQQRWFNWEELEKLEPDTEIFKETLQVIQHLFSSFESLSVQEI